MAKELDKDDPMHTSNNIMKSKATYTNVAKYNLQYLFLLLFVGTIGGYLTSCSNLGDTLIWDFASQTIEIEIVDEEGYSLIEPTTRWGDERLKSIQFEFKGEKFHYEGLPNQQLRALPESYRAVGIKKERSSYLLTFGEFQPHYVEQEIKVTIPGDGVHTIVFTYSARPVGNKSNMSRALWLDGKKVSCETGYRVRLVIDKERWQDYNSSVAEDAPTYLPVTLYFAGIYAPLDKITASNTFVIYKGEKYELVEDYKGDPIYAKDLLLTCGESAFLMGEEGSFAQLFLSFGPFDPQKKYDKEELTLAIQGTPYRVAFTAKLDDNGDPIMDATLLDTQGTDYSEKKMYFRNGPLILLPRY